ncbi:MAG TPA: hypothetical protein VFU16_03405 [Solirubrobacterales bacterium]|nr:hypothetical protein [Solirubrobacterales bacterium]
MVTVLATVVVCSIGVGSALASGFQATDTSTGEGAYPATVSGQAAAADGLSLGGSPGAATCSPNFIGGTLNGTSENMVLQLACTGNVNMGGCYLSVEPGSENAAGNFNATLAVGGSKCAGITFETTVKCKGTITPQTGATGLTVENVSGSPDKVKVFGTASLAATSSGGFGCPASGPTYATWSKIDWAITAAKSGIPVDLSAIAEPVNGISVSGGSFSAENYPASILAQQGTQLAFTAGTGVGTIKCNTAEFAGALSGASSSLALGGGYSSCKDSLGRTVQVAMNGCEYVLNAAGTAGVSCAGSNQIEYKVIVGESVGCLIKVAGQSGLASVGYSNTGSGTESGIDATLNLGSITSTLTGGFFKCGTSKESSTNGTLTGSLSMRGLQEWQTQAWPS